MAYTKQIVPIISVIVPCYNQAQFLSAALDSVLSQTYENWECIVVIDGSTDDTAQIVHKYLAKDDRFKYIYKENGGLSSARNAGITAAQGQYIQFLDADDFIHEEKLFVAMQNIAYHPSCKLVISNFQVYNHDSQKKSAPYCNLDRKISFDDIVKEWDVTFTIPIHCAVFSKSIILQGFKEELKAKEDWILWISVFQQITDYKFINEYHAFYRRHNNNMTSRLDFIEEYTLSAYIIAYNMVQSDILKAGLFEKYCTLSNNMIERFKKLTTDLTYSNSYKLGNLILIPFSFIKALYRKYKVNKPINVK